MIAIRASCIVIKVIQGDGTYTTCSHATKMDITQMALIGQS